MSSEFGKLLRVSVFGQSHGRAIGVNIDGLPAGEAVDLEALQAFLDRRRPGRDPLSTPRKETDQAIILSGLADGVTCGAPLCAIIENADQHSQDYRELAEKPRPGHADYTAWVKWAGQADMRGGGAPLCAIIENADQHSQDYRELAEKPRPGHADYTAWVKWAGQADMRGGGHFSGRLTAPLCIAGGIARQILARRGIHVGAHLRSVGMAEDLPFPLHPTADLFAQVAAKAFPVLDDQAGAQMQAQILEARQAQDSVGGVIECAAIGLPPGLGDPMFEGLENRLAAALFGIPAVKGVEFGAWAASSSVPPSVCRRGWAIPCLRAWKTGWRRPCSASPPSRAWSSARALPPPGSGAL